MFQTAKKVMVRSVILVCIVVFLQLNAQLFLDDINSGEHIHRCVFGGDTLFGEMHDNVTFVFVTIGTIHLFQFDLGPSRTTHMTRQITIESTYLLVDILLRNVIRRRLVSLC